MPIDINNLKLKEKGFAPIILILTVAVLAGLIAGAFYLGKQSNQSANNSQPIIPTNSSTSFLTQIPVASPTSIIKTDETANWKVYKNTKYNFSIKYPQDYSLIKGPASNMPDSYFQNFDDISFGSKRAVFAINVNSKDALDNPIECSDDLDCFQKNLWIIGKKESEVKIVTATILGRIIKGAEYQNKNPLYTQTIRNYVFSVNGNTFRISLTINDLFNELKFIQEEFNQILSTFKFTDQEEAVSEKTSDYIVPVGWKKWAYPGNDFSFFLPPDWIMKDGTQIFYHRDNAFEPQRGIFAREEYKGGSRRDQYMQRFDDYGDCKEKLIQHTSVTELNLNGLSVLQIIPRVDVTKESCNAGPALVFVRGKWLYYFEILRGEGGKVDFWNDAAYMIPFYTIVASIK